LGIRAEYNGLKINPCIPASWKSYKVKRKFRGVIYNIAISNPKGVQKGISEILVNGKSFDNNIIPPPSGIEELDIEVTMG
jgi:cellobiose phosphorylase